MSADEVTHGADADASRVRTGPRHAAPRKPLLARMHVPAGKAIALAAMPTAVLMGMGFTPTLARADEQPASKSLTADEYKACVDAMTAEASPSASPSASKSSADTTDASTSDSKDTTSKDTDAGADSGAGGSSSSDSGSDDTAEPSPSPSSGAASTDTQASSSDDTAAETPAATETSKNILETIGDAIKDVFDGDDSGDATATASPSPSASASESAADSGKDTSSGASKETTEKTDKTAKTSGTVKDAASKAAAAAADTTDTATESPSPSASASASPSPSASASAATDVANCPVATDDVSGVDNKLPLPDDPWYLNASSLLLKDADYQGIVKVKTSGGKTKQVLKYVISGGIEIGDLHQTVIDKKAGKTYHVQARTGLPNSTIDNGDTVMYTESISGNLFGLIPVTFTPENPPPLNIPLIYFTNVKVQQAGQFGGTLTVPGLHQYTT